MAQTPAFLLELLKSIGHQEWIKYGIRNRIVRTFCNYDKVDSQEFDVDFFGLKYKGNLTSYLDWVLYFFGAFEKYELFLMRDIIKNKDRPIFIDIGANVGTHSLFMSQYCECIHAFEPYGLVRKQLEMNVRHNKIGNIFVHNVGLGYKDCHLDYYAPTGHNTGTGSFLQSHETANNQFFGQLQVVNADAYISKLGLENIHLIKIDVEGFEKNVLLGLRDTLFKCRPVLFMEFSPTTQHSFSGKDEIMSILPDNYIIRLVRSYIPCYRFFCRSGYSFSDFNFQSPGGNLVLVPIEKVGTIKNLLDPTEV